MLLEYHSDLGRGIAVTKVRVSSLAVQLPEHSKSRFSCSVCSSAGLWLHSSVAAFCRGSFTQIWRMPGANHEYGRVQIIILNNGKVLHMQRSQVLPLSKR